MAIEFSNNYKHFRLHLDILDNRQPRVEAEMTMQELTTLAQNTAVSNDLSPWLTDV